MKKITVFVLTLTLVMSMGLASAFAATTAQITANGTTVEIAADDQQPYNDDGTVFVPLRAALTAFGYSDDSIAWDQETKVVTTTDESTKLVVTINTNTSEYSLTQGANKWEGKLAVAPRHENNRVMVPIRAFTEIYQKSIGWEQDTQTVIINDYANDEALNSALVTLDAANTNNLVAEQIVKVDVSTDGSYTWVPEDNANLIYTALNGEGTGSYTMYFVVMSTTGESTLTVKAIEVTEDATLPADLTYTISIGE